MDAPGFLFPNGTDDAPGHALLLFLLAYRWEAWVWTASGGAWLYVQAYAAELIAPRGEQVEAWRASLGGMGILSDFR
jgi:hypothetical protein